MDCSPSGSSLHGISQARVWEGVAIFPSRASSWLRDQTCVSGGSRIGRWILYHWATCCLLILLNLLNYCFPNSLLLVLGKLLSLSRVKIFFNDSWANIQRDKPPGITDARSTFEGQNCKEQNFKGKDKFTIAGLVTISIEKVYTFSKHHQHTWQTQMHHSLFAQRNSQSSFQL